MIRDIALKLEDFLIKKLSGAFAIFLHKIYSMNLFHTIEHTYFIRETTLFISTTTTN
jgi:hypothetical protein